MNKKAFEVGMLAIIIITIASFMVIAAVVTKVFANSSETQAEVMCRDSIALRASTIINLNEKDRGNLNLVKGRVKAIPLLCKTIDVKMEGSAEDIKKQMADKMARCWYMFGEGQYEEILHGSSVVPAIYNLDEPDNKCFVCHVALIEEDELPTITSKEFLDYLVTKDYDKAGMKYIDYIQTNRGPGGVQILTNIEPRHAYGITFMAKNKGTTDTTWFGWLGKTAGSLGFGWVTYTVGAAALGACTLATAGICAIGVAALGGTTLVLFDSASTDLKVLVKDFYGATERDLSIITLDVLENAQEYCYTGDLAGK